MKRSFETEILDAPNIPEQLADRAYRDLTRLHRIIGDTRAVIHAIRRDPLPVRRVIDIGCAQGAVPVAIASAHEHLVGGGFDLPPIRPVFDAHINRHGLADRLSFTPGDFFADPLPEADVLVMGHILHDWSLDEKLMLLRKAYEALPPGGALIVYESIIDDARRANTFGLLMSLNMLIETQDGFDYTGADCQSWMTDIGFQDTYVQPLAGPDSMVVGIKPT